MSGFTPTELAWLAIGVGCLLALIFLVIGLLSSKPAAPRQTQPRQPTPRPTPAPQARPTPQAQATPASRPTPAAPPVQPPAPPAQQTSTDDEDEREEVVVIPPPTLPSGVSLVFGIVFSLVAAILIKSLAFLTLMKFFPHALEYKPFAVFAWTITMIVGVLAGLAIFFAGKKPSIEIGSSGVPLFLKGRWPNFLRFLHPEGTPWTIPLVTGVKSVDVTARPLDGATGKDEVSIAALAKVLPPPTQKQVAGRAEKYFLVGVSVKMVVRIQVVDPFLYLSYTDAEGLLKAYITEVIRLYILDLDHTDPNWSIFRLPELKADLQNHLERELDKKGKDMGVDFIKLAVTDIELPKNIQDEATKIPVEMIQRASQVYQGETLEKIADGLRSRFPGLSARELKNLVLQTADLATTQVTSFEGQAIPVVSPQQHGGT